MSPTRAGVDRCPGLRRPFLADDGILVRLRVPGGRLATSTLTELMAVAQEFGAPYLQLTSRGNLQLRALPDPLPEQFVARIEATGLLPSATHELARNVLADPLAPELQPLVVGFDDALCADPVLADLPGRFLVAFGDQTGAVLGERWDLAYQRLSATSGVLLAAGHARPVAPPDAVAALIELARAFLGSREGEHVWHVVDLPPHSPVFAGMQPSEFEPCVPLSIGQAGADLVCGVPLGMLDAPMVEALAQTTEQVVLTPWRSLVVPAAIGGSGGTAARLAASGLVVETGSGWEAVSACVGAPSCRRTTVPTMELAREAVRQLPLASGTTPARVHVSGCERRCGAPAQHHEDVLMPTAAEMIITAATPAAASEDQPRVPTPRYDYVRNGLEIYRRSFAMIRDEARLAGLDGDLATVATRIIHASGDTALVHDIAAHPDVIVAARTALREGRPILTDSMMLASGITWRRLPAGNEVVCTLRDPQAPGLAAAWGTTRAAAAVSLWMPYLEGAVVAIGNAPTALFHLLEMLHDGAPRPAAIIGMPVGFIGSAESKAALAEHALAGGAVVPWMVLHGRRGGSAVAASAVNAIATPDELA